MWRVGSVSISISSSSGDSSSEKKKRRQSIHVGVSEPKRRKLENVVIIEDPKSPAAKGVSKVNEQGVETQMMSIIC